MKRRHERSIHVFHVNESVGYFLSERTHQGDAGNQLLGAKHVTCKLPFGNFIFAKTLFRIFLFTKKKISLWESGPQIKTLIT